jgi:hypothetical protein
LLNAFAARLARSRGSHDGVERIALPQVQRVDGLHVVMSIKKHVRAAVALLGRNRRKHNRVAAALAVFHVAGLHEFCIKTQLAKLIARPLTRRSALVAILGISRNTGNAQPVDKTLLSGGFVLREGIEDGHAKR